MKFNFEMPDGKKSIDVKARKLIVYVNDNINNIGWSSEEEAARWAKKTIEQGIINIASSCFAYRIE